MHPPGGVLEAPDQGVRLALAGGPRQLHGEALSHQDRDPTLGGVPHTPPPGIQPAPPETATTVLHAVSVCGVVGDRDSNSALWQDMLHHLSGLGNAPHIVGADGNIPLGRLRDVPQAMLAHLLTRQLVDLDLEYAGSEERYQCGYTWGEEVATTHINGVLADPRTASTVLRVERIPIKGILEPQLVPFDLAVGAAG